MNNICAEARLIRLEENSWFQEEKLKALDSQMRELQAQLTALERQLANFQNAMGQMREYLDAASGNLGQAAAQQPPPHYEPKLW